MTPTVIPGRASARTSDMQLHIGESLDSAFDAEPVIGPCFARTRWHRPGMTAASRLRLRLALPPGLIDLDRDRQRFHAAAIAGAAHRRGAEIIEADGDAGVRVGGADAVCRIEPDPAEIGYERLHPGVAGLLIDHPVGAQEMSGNEARGNAGAARACDKDMRIVLTHPALQCEGFHRRGPAVG